MSDDDFCEVEDAGRVDSTRGIGRTVKMCFVWTCERCGGTGRQEAGVYNPATRRYDAPAGVCDACSGKGTTSRDNYWNGCRDGQKVDLTDKAE